MFVDRFKAVRTSDEMHPGGAVTADFVSSPTRQVPNVEQAVLDNCQKIIGYTFADKSLLALALTHSSVAPTRTQSNERLEFLGDAVLGLIVCHNLHDHGDELLEGEMTRVKSVVVSRQICAEVAEELGISQLIFLGKGLASSGELPMSVSAAVFESIIGAIYLDGGLEPARKFILSNVGHYLKKILITQHEQNHKSVLQQHAQRRWNTKPEYQLLDVKGPDHSKCFEVAVAIDGVHFPSAWGMSKKEAEQEAARQALIKLNLLPNQSRQDQQKGGPKD